MGFWLSYGAVAILMLAFSGRHATSVSWPGRSFFQAQWAVFIGLLVPLAVLLNNNALLAPVAMVLAIPLVTFAVVSWLLMGGVLDPFWPWLRDLYLRMAEVGLPGL